MIAGLHISNEIRKFKRGRLTRIALIAIVLMPLLYSALYLWAFWDPFTRVNNLPVALVNQDVGTTVNGKEVNAGKQVAQGLEDNKQINWTVTDAEDAQEGVSSGKYYFALQLPKNFSEAVASPTGDKPEKASLIAQYNDANGYLSTVIGQNAMNQVLTVVGEEISSQAVDQILIGVINAGNGLAQASEGAGKLAQGTGELNTGIKKLDDGAGTLTSGLEKAKSGTAELLAGHQKLDSGMAELKEGSGQLAAGTQELEQKVSEATGKVGELTSGVDQLSAGAAQLGDGAQQINNGVQQIKGLTDKVTAVHTQQSAELRKISARLRAIPGMELTSIAQSIDNTARILDTQGLGADAEWTAKIGQLSYGTSQLAYQLGDTSAPFRGGIEKLNTATDALPAKVQQLENGVQQLNNGAHKLDQGIGTAQNGASQLTAGTQKLDEGNAQLLDGAQKLHQGTQSAAQGSTKLEEGAHTLFTKLDEGAQKSPQWNEGERVLRANTIGAPVELNQDNDAGQHTFGEGLAPFFFCLALFIGGVMTFVLIRPIQSQAVAAGLSPLRVAFHGFLPAGLISMAQAAVMVAVTIWAVGLKPDTILGLFAFSFLVAIVNMLINQMFIVVFGSGPGKILALAYLMLQMLSSGGLYPVETQNRFFQVVHWINPMTYGVDGFRQVIYGFYDYRLPVAICALLIFGLIAFGLTSMAARKHRVWTMKSLHPPLTA